MRTSGRYVALAEQALQRFYSTPGNRTSSASLLAEAQVYATLAYVAALQNAQHVPIDWQ
jgi:hypothetical protein